MDVALADKLDSVLDHFPKGSSIKKKYVLFRVRWSGSPLEEDTWEPYANVRECEALDSYIRANVQDHPELKSLYHKWYKMLFIPFAIREGDWIVGSVSYHISAAIHR